MWGLGNRRDATPLGNCESQTLCFSTPWGYSCTPSGVKSYLGLKFPQEIMPQKSHGAVW